MVPNIDTKIRQRSDTEFCGQSVRRNNYLKVHLKLNEDFKKETTGRSNVQRFKDGNFNIIPGLGDHQLSAHLNMPKWWPLGFDLTDV